MAYDLAATEQYIREAAKARGIDPDTAVRVAKSEGLAKGVYQSNLGKGGTREPSYGPFQLLVGGAGTNYPAGMGNDFISQTGLDPRDPSTVNAQVDFALDNAAERGWGAWYGAKASGIGNRDGIAGNPTSAPRERTRELSMGAPSMAGYPTTVGGLGGLGGMVMEEEPAPGGVAGFFQNPNVLDAIQAMGMSMMSSPSNNVFAGVPDALPQLQKQRMTQEALAVERQDKLNNQRAMQAALMQSGFSEEQAAAYASNPQAASVAAGAMEDRRQTAQQAAGYSATANYLEAQGASPDLVELARSGQGSEAMRLYSASLKNVEVSPEAQKIADREAAASAQGLTPGTPEYRAYVLTGSMPSAERNVTAGDRQAIREADDQVMTADNAEIALQRALGLSGKALEGWTAPARGAMANNLPDALLPDFIFGSPEEGQATAELDNTVTAGALEQMKAIFGGNPTEGERAILLEIQGSSNQPRPVREAIYKRALETVRRKREFNKDRAQELRGGDYYSPDRPTKGSGIRQKYGLE